MRTVEEQHARIAEAAVELEPQRVSIVDARGLVCAEEVTARRPLPGFDQAAVAGYAVRSIDVADAGPDHKGQFGQPADLALPVVGEIRAGARQIPRLQPQQAVRVEAGAPLPALADAVVPLDGTNGDRAKVAIFHPIKPGTNIREAGDDVRVGDVAVAEGTLVSAAHVALLASVGRTDVLVRSRPRITIIAVGPELVDIAFVPDMGQVYDVNSYALAAAATEAGAIANRVGIIDPYADAVRSAIAEHLPRTDILIITGGVGGRASDTVQEALLDFGNIEISRVGMHPGGVQGFGMLGDRKVPTFLLSELPTSVLVVFEVMVRPLVRTMLGRPDPYRRRVQARTVNDFTSEPGVIGYVRGKLMRDGRGKYHVRALGAVDGANRITHLADANCLIEVGPGTTHVGAGETVPVAFLAQRG
ncbi:molybdotransferase-like divisome protein Glp [Lolliginicoccus suaedae]|uniref:molybdotransferase-like divisome protein Glp n=1 Tax=Lolliginicoccus suaedae TaxID=2605429 RepID=UPI0011EF7D50|nr:gephyrin-like molybdotransferase Glp [Lolliginicoccus suaedae]